mgnify:CR=1 FL=1
MEIFSLSDLTRLRSAPLLDEMQSKILLSELNLKISDCDWITIGIMGSNDSEAKIALQEMIKRYSFKDFQDFEDFDLLLETLYNPIHHHPHLLHVFYKLCFQ